MKRITETILREYQNEDDRHNSFVGFAQTADPLEIDETQISGDWLVVGPGPLFPERLLLCSPETNFRKLRGNISSVTCCERQDSATIRFRIEGAVRYAIRDIPRRELGLITVFDRSLQKSAEYLDDKSFNGVLSFRIPDLGYQFPELLPEITRVLKADGLYIGSGSFEDSWDQDPISPIAARFGLVAEKILRLPNRDKDYINGASIIKHFGFKL